jgi:hypothetical protein
MPSPRKIKTSFFEIGEILFSRLSEACGHRRAFPNGVLGRGKRGPLCAFGLTPPASYVTAAMDSDQEKALWGRR